MTTFPVVVDSGSGDANLEFTGGTIDDRSIDTGTSFPDVPTMTLPNAVRSQGDWEVTARKISGPRSGFGWPLLHAMKIEHRVFDFHRMIRAV